MSPISIIKHHTSFSEAVPRSAARLRSSLHQSVREQLQQLCTDFFDEVDDFLFASGQQGQFTDQGVYLKSMREFRAKQRLFEETLLQSISRNLKLDSCLLAPDSGTARRQGSSDVVFEKVEVDLALQAMQRKASKYYLPFIKQIDSMNARFCIPAQQQAIVSHALIESTMGAFAEAQNVFLVKLDVRLVFIKLFEQKFLMKMDKLFLEIISILKSVSGEIFVAEPSSSAVKPQFSATHHECAAEEPDAVISVNYSQKSEAVELAVDNWVRKTCAQRKLPFFVEKMIRTQWRAVMFLIGLNRGITSTVWSEAKQSVALLVAVTTAGISGRHAPVDIESMKAQLQQGFGLIQLGEAEQDQFFQSLDRQLHHEVVAGHIDDPKSELTSAGISNSSIESTICPSGEQLLDNDDLNEIAKLMGAARNEANNTMIESRLTDYFPEIERLDEGAPIEFLLNGSYRSFAVSKNNSTPELFEISSNDDNIKITKSKLGLAISLQNGELRFPSSDSSLKGLQETILDVSPSRSRS